MNGLCCYLSRDEAKEILAAAVNARLNPERLLGECQSDIQVFDDGRVEVAFWSDDPPANGQANGEADGAGNGAPAKPAK